jgi:acyl carrier protein
VTGWLTTFDEKPTSRQGTWPPENAQPLPVATFYDDMASFGYGYGPAFRGLRAAWRREDEFFTEVVLPDNQRQDRFALHPALLDAAAQIVAAAETEPRLAFVWSGVSLSVRGAHTLRITVTRRGPELFSVLATDTTGRHVLSVAGLALRPVRTEPESGQAAHTPAPQPVAADARTILHTVRVHLACVLGHDSPEDVDPDRSFRDLGVDSVAAVRLRDRLAAATGLRLPAVLVFSHPTPAELAERLREEMGAAHRGTALDELDRLEHALARLTPEESIREELLRRLEALTDRYRDPVSGEWDGTRLETATADEVFELIDSEFRCRDVEGI